MILVTTTGTASMDTYVQQISKYLPTSKLFTDIYDLQDFNVPLFSPVAMRTMWHNIMFTHQLRHLRQPLHLPNHHFGRYGCFLTVPYVVTVADLMRFFDLKSDRPLIHSPNLLDKLYLKLDYAGIRKATAVIAISYTTKRDLVRWLGIPEDRVFVVYLGVDHHRFRPLARRLLDVPYILFVGSEYPYKNLTNLLKAFHFLKQAYSLRDLKLVKVGRAGGGREGPFRQQTLELVNALHLQGEVLFTDRVKDEDLPAYYSGAACLVVPSLYEGFGLPPIEAMACGCPVIVSDMGALPEITGSAALLVDPLEPQDIANAIVEVLHNATLKRDLISQGLKHSGSFTWERTAEETLAVYREM